MSRRIRMEAWLLGFDVAAWLGWERLRLYCIGKASDCVEYDPIEPYAGEDAPW